MLGGLVETRCPLATDVRQEDVVRAEGLDRSLFSVLRRGDVNEEVQRRGDEVEDRLEGWREGEDEGCAARFSK